MADYIQGRFIPRRPEKYVGNSAKIQFRSSWERKLMVFFDTNPAILQWNSEEVVIPYISPLDNKPHRYYIDFSVLYRTKAGDLKKAIIEVKPQKQILPPKKPQRMTKHYINEVQTYAVNQSKWESAKKWAAQKGYDFMLLNEYDLGIK